MEKLAQNIQEAFLNNARKDKTFLTIYLMSGVKLSGRIKSFDKYSVILEANNQEQLIFKHAISTVLVSRPLHGRAGIAAQALPALGRRCLSRSSRTITSSAEARGTHAGGGRGADAADTGRRAEPRERA